MGKGKKGKSNSCKKRSGGRRRSDETATAKPVPADSDEASLIIACASTTPTDGTNGNAAPFFAASNSQSAAAVMDAPPPGPNTLATTPLTSTSAAFNMHHPTDVTIPVTMCQGVGSVVPSSLSLKPIVEQSSLSSHVHVLSPPLPVGGPGGPSRPSPVSKTITIFVVTSLPAELFVEVVCKFSFDHSTVVEKRMDRFTQWADLLDINAHGVFRLNLPVPHPAAVNQLSAHFKAKVKGSNELVGCNRWSKLQQAREVEREKKEDGGLFPPAVVFYIPDKFNSNWFPNSQQPSEQAQSACFSLLARALLETNVPPLEIGIYMTKSLLQFIDKSFSNSHTVHIRTLRHALSNRSNQVNQSAPQTPALIEMSAVVIAFNICKVLQIAPVSLTAEHLDSQCDIVELASLFLLAKKSLPIIFSEDFGKFLQQRLSKIAEKQPVAIIGAFLLGFTNELPNAALDGFTSDIRTSLDRHFKDDPRATQLLDSEANTLEECLVRAGDDPMRLEGIVRRWLHRPSSIVTETDFRHLTGTETDGLAIRVPDIFCTLVVERKMRLGSATGTGRARVDGLVELFRVTDAINKKFSEKDSTSLNNTIAERLSKHLATEVTATLTTAVSEESASLHTRGLSNDELALERNMLDLEIRFLILERLRAFPSLASSRGVQGTKPQQSCGFGLRTSSASAVITGREGSLNLQRPLIYVGASPIGTLPGSWSDNPALFDARIHLLVDGRVPSVYFEDERSAVWKGLESASSGQRVVFRCDFKKFLKESKKSNEPLKRFDAELGWSLWFKAWTVDFKQSIKEATILPLEVALGVAHCGDQLPAALAILVSPTAANLFVELDREPLSTDAHEPALSAEQSSETRQNMATMVANHWAFFEELWKRIASLDLTADQFGTIKRTPIFDGFKRIISQIHVAETIVLLEEASSLANQVYEKKMLLLRPMLADRRYRATAQWLSDETKQEREASARTTLAKLRQMHEENPFAVSPENHPLLQPHATDSLLQSGVFENVSVLVDKISDHHHLQEELDTGGVLVPLDRQPLSSKKKYGSSGRLNFAKCIAEWRQGLTERYVPAYEQVWVRLANGTMPVTEALFVFLPQCRTLVDRVQVLNRAAATGLDHGSDRVNSVSDVFLQSLRDKIIQQIGTFVEEEARTALALFGNQSTNIIDVKACVAMMRSVVTAILVSDTVKYFANCCDRLHAPRPLPHVTRLLAIADDLPVTLGRCEPLRSGAKSPAIDLSCGKVAEIIDTLSAARDEGAALLQMCPGFAHVFAELLDEGLCDVLGQFLPDDDLRSGTTRLLEAFIEERSPEIDEDSQALLDHLLKVAKQMVMSSRGDTQELIKKRRTTSSKSLLSYLSLCAASFPHAAQLRGNLADAAKLKTDTDSDAAIVNALRILTGGCFAIGINRQTEVVEVTASFQTTQKPKQFDAEALRDIGPNILLTAGGGKIFAKDAAVGDENDDLLVENDESNLVSDHLTRDNNKMGLKTAESRRRVSKWFVTMMVHLDELVEIIETMRKVGHPNVNCLPLTVRSGGSDDTLDVQELISTLADEVEAWKRFTDFIITKIRAMNVIPRRLIPTAIQTAECVLTAAAAGNDDDKNKGLQELAKIFSGICFRDLTGNEIQRAALLESTDFLKATDDLRQSLPIEMRTYPFTDSALKVAVLVEKFFNWGVFKPHQTTTVSSAMNHPLLPRLSTSSGEMTCTIWRIESKNNTVLVDSSTLLPLANAIYLKERGRCPLPFETLLVTERSEHTPQELADFLSSWRRCGNMFGSERGVMTNTTTTTTTIQQEPEGVHDHPLPLFTIINADLLPRHMQEQLVQDFTDKNKNHSTTGLLHPPLLLLTTRDCTIAHNMRKHEFVLLQDSVGYKNLISSTMPLLKDLVQGKCTVVSSGNEPQTGKTRYIRSQCSEKKMVYGVVSISARSTLESVGQEISLIHSSWSSMKSKRRLALHLDISPEANGSFVAELLFRWLYQGRFSNKSGALCVWHSERRKWKLFVEIPALAGHNTSLHISTVAPFFHHNVLKYFQFQHTRFTLQDAAPLLFLIDRAENPIAEFGSSCLVAFAAAQSSETMQMSPGGHIAKKKVLPEQIEEAIKQILKDSASRSGQLRFFHLATHQMACALGENTMYYSDYSAVDRVLTAGCTMLAFHICELICQCAHNLTCDAIPPKASAHDSEAERMERMVGFDEWSRKPFAIYNTDDFRLFSLNDNERVLDRITEKNTNPLFRMFIGQQSGLRQMDRSDLQSHAQQASASQNIKSVFTILGITSTRPNLCRLLVWREKLPQLSDSASLQDAEVLIPNLNQDLLAWFHPLMQTATHQSLLNAESTVRDLRDEIERWWRGVFGTYTGTIPPFVLTADLVVRLAAMKARLLSGVSVVWVGDQGCGKTYVCQAFARGSGCEHFTINCNGSVSAEDLLKALLPWIARAKASPEKLFLMQLDEFNTLDNVWNAHQIICDRVLLGHFIPENILCMAIMNPTKVRTEEQRKAFEAVDTAGGLNYTEYAEKNRNLAQGGLNHATTSHVYDVNACPEALLALAFDFGSAATTFTARDAYESDLTRWVSIPGHPNDAVSDEIRFAESNVHWMERNKLIAFQKLKFERFEKTYGFNAELCEAEDAGGTRVHWIAFRTILVTMMRASQTFLRGAFKGETSVVSLRDMKKVTTILPFIFECCVARQRVTEVPPQTSFLAFRFLSIAMQIAFVMTYHLRLDPKNRAAYLECIHLAWTAAHSSFRGLHKEFLPPPTNAEEIYTKAFDGMAEFAVSCLTQQNDLVPNQALKENTLACIVAIKLNLTLFIVGRAGSSKTRSLQSLHDASDAARRSQATDARNFLREIRFDIVLQTLQCSRHTRARDVTRVVQGAARIQANAAREGRFTKAVVVLEEAGATTGSPHNPFMSLHGIIDFGVTLHNEREGETTVRVPIIGVSNWQLGAQKMGRGNIVHRGNPPLEDLIKTGQFFLEDTAAWLDPVCREFLWILEGTNPTLTKFFGMRDTYTFYRVVTDLARLDTNEFFGRDKGNRHNMKTDEVIEQRPHLAFWAVVMALGGLPTQYEALQNKLFERLEACFRICLPPQGNVIAQWEHKGSGGSRYLCDICAYFTFLGVCRSHRGGDEGTPEETDPVVLRRHRSALFNDHFTTLSQSRPCENFFVAQNNTQRTEKDNRVASRAPPSRALTASSADAQATCIIAYGLAKTTMRHTLIFTKNVCTLRLLHKLGLVSPKDTIIVGEPRDHTGLAEQLRSVKECMARGGHVIIAGLHLTEILLEPLNMNYQVVGTGDALTHFTRLPLADGRSKRVRINPSFRCTILCDERNADKLLPPFIQRFTRVNLSFGAVMCPTQRDAMAATQAVFLIAGEDGNHGAVSGTLLSLAIPGFTDESLASLFFLPGAPVVQPPMDVDLYDESCDSAASDTTHSTSAAAAAKDCYLAPDKIHNRLRLCLLPKVLAEIDHFYQLDHPSLTKVKRFIAASIEPTALLYRSGNLSCDMVRAWQSDVSGAPTDAPARHFLILSEQRDFVDACLMEHCTRAIEDGYAKVKNAHASHICVIGPHKGRGSIVELADDSDDFAVALRSLRLAPLGDDEVAISIVTLDCTRMSHRGAALASTLFHHVSAADLGERRHVFVFITVTNPLTVAKTLTTTGDEHEEFGDVTKNAAFTLMFDPDWTVMAADTITATESYHEPYLAPDRLPLAAIVELLLKVLPAEATRAGVTELTQQLWLTSVRHPELFVAATPQSIQNTIGGFAASALGTKLLTTLARKVVALEIFDQGTWPRLALQCFKDVEPSLRGLHLRFLTAVWYRAVLPLLEHLLIFGLLQRAAAEDRGTVSFLEALVAEPLTERAPVIPLPHVSAENIDVLMPLRSSIAQGATIRIVATTPATVAHQQQQVHDAMTSAAAAAGASYVPWTPCIAALIRLATEQALGTSSLDEFIATASNDAASPLHRFWLGFSTVGQEAEDRFVEDFARTILLLRPVAVQVNTAVTVIRLLIMAVLAKLSSKRTCPQMEERTHPPPPLWLAILALHRFEPSALRPIFNLARDEKTAARVHDWCRHNSGRCIHRGAVLEVVWVEYDHLIPSLEMVADLEVLCRLLPPAAAANGRGDDPATPITRGILCADDPQTWRWHQLLASLVTTVLTTAQDHATIRRACRGLVVPASLVSELMPFLRSNLSPEVIQVLLSILLEWLPTTMEALVHLHECIAEFACRRDVPGPIISALLRAAFLLWVDLGYPPFSFNTADGAADWLPETTFNVVFRELTRGDRFALLLGLMQERVLQLRRERPTDDSPELCFHQTATRARLYAALDILARSLRGTICGNEDEDSTESSQSEVDGDEEEVEEEESSEDGGTEQKDAADDSAMFISCTLDADTNSEEIDALSEATQALLAELSAGDIDAATVFFLRQASNGGLDTETLRHYCMGATNGGRCSFPIPVALQESAMWLRVAAFFVDGATTQEQQGPDAFLRRYVPDLAMAVEVCTRGARGGLAVSDTTFLTSSSRVAAVLTLCARQEITAAQAGVLLGPALQDAHTTAQIDFLLKPTHPVPPPLLSLLVHLWVSTKVAASGSVLDWLHQRVSASTAKPAVPLPGVASSVEYDLLMMDPTINHIYECPNGHKYGTNNCEHINGMGVCVVCKAPIGGPKYNQLYPGNKYLGLAKRDARSNNRPAILLNESHFKPTEGWDVLSCRPIRGIPPAPLYMIRMLTLFAVLTRTLLFPATTTPSPPPRPNNNNTNSVSPNVPSLLGDATQILKAASDDLLGKGQPESATLRWMHAVLAVVPLGTAHSSVGRGQPLNTREDVEKAMVDLIGSSPQTDAVAVAEERLYSTVNVTDILLDTSKYKASVSNVCPVWLSAHRPPTTAAELSAFLQAHPASLSATLTRLQPSLSPQSARNLAIFGRYLQVVQQTAAALLLTEKAASRMSLADLFPHNDELKDNFKECARATTTMVANLTRLNCLADLQETFRDTIEAFQKALPDRVPLRTLLPANSDDGLFSQFVVCGTSEDTSRSAHAPAQNAVCGALDGLFPANAHSPQRRTVAVTALQADDVLAFEDARGLVFDHLLRSFMDSTGRHAKIVVPGGGAPGLILPDLCITARAGLVQVPAIITPLPTFTFSSDALSQLCQALMNTVDALPQPDHQSARLMLDMLRTDEQTASDVLDFLGLVAALQILTGRPLEPTLPLLDVHDPNTTTLTPSQARGHRALFENQHRLATCQLQHLPALCAFLWKGPVAQAFSVPFPVEIPINDEGIRASIAALRALSRTQQAEALIAFRVAGLTQLRQSGGEGRFADAPLVYTLQIFSKLFDDEDDDDKDNNDDDTNQKKIGHCALFQLPTRYYTAIRTLLDQELPLVTVCAPAEADEGKQSLASVFRCPKRRRRLLQSGGGDHTAASAADVDNNAAVRVGGLSLGALNTATNADPQEENEGDGAASSSPPLTARTALLRQQQQLKGTGTGAISWARPPQFVTR